MRRVPASSVLVLLRRSGIHLTPAGLRNWTRRGHISAPTAEGYDLREVLAYLDRRANMHQRDTHRAS